MIVLDTNVVSEAMKPEPNPAVRAWLNAQVAETLYLSSVTLAELLFGIGALPEGRRKHGLSETLDGLLALFGDRVLMFDTGAARHYAELAVKARLASNWRMERLDSTLRALLRAGAWELRHRPDVPREIVIDEYVELAKAFFDDAEAKFVNAALDGVARDARAS